MIKKSYLGVGSFLLIGSLGWAVGTGKNSNQNSIPPSVEVLLAGKKCDLFEDAQKIPHIRGENELVALACFGYIHGRDRAWQMDFFRKTVQGRKSEIFGKDSIKSDFFLRLLGLREKAHALFQEMKEEDRKILWAYSYGVNRGMREAKERGIYELDQLRISDGWPEEWHPEDSLGLVLLQSFDQTQRSFENQVREVGWTDSWGEKAKDLFSEEGLPWNTLVLKKGEYPQAQVKASLLRPDQTLAANRVGDSPFQTEETLFSTFGGIGAGSNNWVLAPQLSRDGKAWMANDPHLKLAHPPFWQWVHIEGGGLDAIGASFPGTPFIVSGANRHVSWGLTNAYLPASRLSWVPESELKGASKSFPLIWVKVWKLRLPFFFKSFRKTPGNLPVIPIPSPDGKAVVLRWTGFDLKASDVVDLFKIARVKSTSQMDRVLAQVGVPSWNFVFADDQGKIGYRAIGRIPRFGKELAWGIPSQSLAEVESSYAFSHPLSPSEMPHLLNPARGFIVTANNKQWPMDSQWNGGVAQAVTFRAFRIEELLKKTNRHDLPSIQATQCDVQAVDARFILPELLKLLKPQDQATSENYLAIEALRSWDYEASVECRACGLYRRWVGRILKEQSLNIISLYRKLIQNPVDLQFQEKAIQAFEVALMDLKYSEQKELPKWGDLHLNSFTHLAGPEYFKAQPISTPGDDFSVNPGTSDWSGEHFTHNYGASQRLIVEMSSPPKVYSVVAGSNDDRSDRKLDDPKSEWQKWVQCEQLRREFPFDWAKVKAQQVRLDP